MKKVLAVIAACLLCTLMAVPVLAGTSGDIEKPTISLVRNFADGVHVTWSGTDDADGYYVYRSMDDGQFYRVADVSEAFYIDADTEPAHKYSYKLKAYKESEAGPVLSPCSGKKSTYRIRATEITSIANQTRAIKITWTEVPEAHGYKVYRKLRGEDEYRLLITKEGPGNTSFVNTAVQNGAIYSYLVKPYITSPTGSNYYNYHDDSVEAARLPKMADVSATASAGQSIRVSWSPIDGVDGYVVSQKNIGTGKAKNYYVWGCDSSETTIETVPPGAYSYTVRACAGEFKGPFSEKSQINVPEIITEASALSETAFRGAVNAANMLLGRECMEVEAVHYAVKMSSNWPCMAVFDGVDAPEGAVLFCIDKAPHVADYTLESGTLSFLCNGDAAFVLVSVQTIDEPCIESLSEEACSAAVDKINESLRIFEWQEIEEVLYSALVTPNGRAWASVAGIEVPEGAVLFMVNSQGVYYLNYLTDGNSLSFWPEGEEPCRIILARVRNIN